MLIKNLWMSIDAGQRNLMGAGAAKVGDLPPKRFALGEAMHGQAVGQVIESRSAKLPVRTFVTSNFGWREYLTCDVESDSFTLSAIDATAAPIQSYLHVMSVYGAAAYYALTEVARIESGDTVWISTAAGTVGSIACQLARMHGCRVIGTTSTDAKARWLTDDLKINAAINYRKADDLRVALKDACPEGLDVYVDFVGCEHPEAAIDLMKPHGRIVLIGQTSIYDGGTPSGPQNIFSVVLKRLRIERFTVFDYLDAGHMSKFRGLMAGWTADGKVKAIETVYEGIENAVQAQVDLFQGKNVGKMLVKLGNPA